MSWVKQKATPNLKDAKAETRVALPSLMTVGTQPMLTILEVKGAATEASAVDSDIPEREESVEEIMFNCCWFHLRELSSEHRSHCSRPRT